jgi:hypothetical protein
MSLAMSRSANPGIYASLLKHEPQGINPQILLLDLFVIQKPGIWPQIVVNVQARYDQIVKDHTYNSVTILYDGQELAAVKVEIVT